MNFTNEMLLKAKEAKSAEDDSYNELISQYGYFSQPVERQRIDIL